MRDSAQNLSTRGQPRATDRNTDPTSLSKKVAGPAPLAPSMASTAPLPPAVPSEPPTRRPRKKFVRTQHSTSSSSLLPDSATKQRGNRPPCRPPPLRKAAPARPPPCRAQARAPAPEASVVPVAPALASPGIPTAPAIPTAPIEAASPVIPTAPSLSNPPVRPTPGDASILTTEPLNSQKATTVSKDQRKEEGTNVSFLDSLMSVKLKKLDPDHRQGSRRKLDTAKDSGANNMQTLIAKLREQVAGGDDEESDDTDEDWDEE